MQIIATPRQNRVSHDVGKPKMSKLANRLHDFMFAYEKFNSVEMNDVLFVDFNCRFSLRPMKGRCRPHPPPLCWVGLRERGLGVISQPLLWIILLGDRRTCTRDISKSRHDYVKRFAKPLPIPPKNPRDMHGHPYVHHFLMKDRKTLKPGLHLQNSISFSLLEGKWKPPSPHPHPLKKKKFGVGEGEGGVE